MDSFWWVTISLVFAIPLTFLYHAVCSEELLDIIERTNSKRWWFSLLLAPALIFALAQGLVGHSIFEGNFDFATYGLQSMTCSLPTAVSGIILWILSEDLKSQLETVKLDSSAEEEIYGQICHFQDQFRRVTANVNSRLVIPSVTVWTLYILAQIWSVVAVLSKEFDKYFAYEVIMNTLSVLASLMLNMNLILPLAVFTNSAQNHIHNLQTSLCFMHSSSFSVRFMVWLTHMQNTDHFAWKVTSVSITFSRFMRGAYLLLFISFTFITYSTGYSV